MTLDTLKESIPDYARDLRLNLGSVLSTQGSPGLSEKQIWSVALATAIAARDVEFARSIETLAHDKLDSAHLNAARAARSAAMTTTDACGQVWRTNSMTFSRSCCMLRNVVCWSSPSLLPRWLVGS